MLFEHFVYTHFAELPNNPNLCREFAKILHQKDDFVFLFNLFLAKFSTNRSNCWISVIQTSDFWFPANLEGEFSRWIILKRLSSLSVSSLNQVILLKLLFLFTGKLLPKGWCSTVRAERKTLSPKEDCQHTFYCVILVKLKIHSSAVFRDAKRAALKEAHTS